MLKPASLFPFLVVICFVIPASVFAQAESSNASPTENISDTTAQKSQVNDTSKTLNKVTVISSRPFIQQAKGKTILNVDASPTNAGTTVLEVLEKAPGVLVDRNGGISLRGKSSVLVLIDDKPTYLSGADLNNLLRSMSSSAVSQIELINNPSAKYDASGNAGIINIKTKKNRAQGLNGSFSTSFSQGIYPKNNNSLAMNYRKQKINLFLNYSMNAVKYLTDIYAYRKYYGSNDSLLAILEQPTYFTGRFINHNFKTGLDYTLSKKTSIGFTAGGNITDRKGTGEASATWMSPALETDSTVKTFSTSINDVKSLSFNVNARHNLQEHQTITADLDYLSYEITNQQFFDNEVHGAGNYSEASRGDIPSKIKIYSGKADHEKRWGKHQSLQSGIKFSHITTDNLANFESFHASEWKPDFGKSNHFLYDETISAVYSMFESKAKKLTYQAGLRYEHTQYNAYQAGNQFQKDSGFSKNYSGLFPSGYISYEMDSSNSFTVTAGRRLDRPAFQKLNPFYFIINKYTYQTGNPFFQPQYSWNFELSHQYKGLLTTTISYSETRNYFSQLFLTDTVSGILLYTEGNVGKAKNIGASVAASINPAKWWMMNAHAFYNYKFLSGYNGKDFSSDINQFRVSMNNQFRLGEDYTAEVSGFYTGRARNDLQELLYPTGQLSAGISKLFLKRRGTLKFSIRDMFYSQAMEGLTDFENASEYFILKRDSRVATLSFSYRFGEAAKGQRRSSGSAKEEIERAQ